MAERYNIVAVIPVLGRLTLLPYTIERLLKKNGVVKVICVGKDEREKTVSELAGAKFLYHDNEPLGKKWNHGFQWAREFSPEAVLFAGSSDWVSDNWLAHMMQYREYDLIGKPDFNLLDIGPLNKLRMCHWAGYEGERKGESIGIGRVISARILDKMNWKPFNDAKHNCMDSQMQEKVIARGGKLKLVTSEEIDSLSLSTYKWTNKHVFNEHWMNILPSTHIQNPRTWLRTRFPEALNMKL